MAQRPTTNHDINKDELTSVTKILAGNGVFLQSNGVDSGTGEVTLIVSGTVTNGDSHDHVGGDGAALKYSNIIGGNGVATTVAASTTTNLTLFASGFIATGANAPISKAGTLKNLYIRISGAQPASGNMVFDVMINNSTSGITCTLAAGAGGAGLTLSDTTHTAAVSIGDLIRVQTVNNATGASAPVGVWMMELETTTT